MEKTAYSMKEYIYKSYQKASLLIKLSIPPMLVLILGAILIMSILKEVQNINLEIKTLQYDLIPSLETSTSNMALLKNLSENFTFAVLASEADMLPSKKDSLKIEKNLQNIVYNKQLAIEHASLYLNLFKKYFSIAKDLSIKMINGTDILASQSERSKEMIHLYNEVEKNFLTLNKRIKKKILQKTEFVNSTTTQIIYFTIIFIISFSAILFFISHLIYYDFHKRFKSLSDKIEKLTLIDSSEPTFKENKDELSVLLSNIQSVIKKFDILEKEKEKITKISQKDQLTNLYNRHYLTKFFKVIESKNLSYGIILLDIDHFKHINDTYGHPKGDDILVEFSNILQNNSRKEDIIFRFGGEEFLMVIPNATKEMLIAHTEKLRLSIEKHYFAGVGTVTASFGVALYSKNISSKQIIHLADKALYRAKENGRNRVEF